MNTTLLESPDSIRNLIVTKDGDIYYNYGLPLLYCFSADGSKRTFNNVPTGSLRGMAYDGDNFIYICDVETNCIFRFDISKQKLELFAGPKYAKWNSQCTALDVYDRNTQPRHDWDGYRGQARFIKPTGIAFSDGALYITERGAVRRIDLATSIVSTVPIPLSVLKISPLRNATRIAVDKSGIYLSEAGSSSIVHIGVDDTISVIELGSRIEIAQMVLQTDRLLIIQNRSLCSVDLVTHKINKVWSEAFVESFTVDHRGLIYISTSGCNLIRIKEKWRFTRLLFIGQMKNHTSECDVAKLPREIIREISSHL